MKFKKIIAAISATAMLITSSMAVNVVSSASDDTGFPFPFENYVGEYIPVGDYAVEGAENVVYHIRTNGADSSVAIVRTEDASDGARSLRIRGADTAPSGTTLCTEFTIEFGEEIVGETYEVSFDAWREASDWRDYAAINYEGWDGASRLTGTTKWTVEELGAGSEIGGVGSGTWSRYTASFTTDIAPQLNFAVAGWGELHLDNIIVKDSSGNVVFADSFESSGPVIGVVATPEDPEEPTDPDEPGDEPTDPDEPGEETGFKFPLEDYVGKDIPEGEYGVEGAENVKYIFTFDDAGTPNAQVSTEYATDGTRSLIMGAKGTANKQQGLGAGFTLKFGDPTADGKYVISFDVWIEGGNYRDYAALNNDGWDGKAQLSDANTKTQWTITNLGAGQAVGGVGEGTWSRYTATLSTIADDPQLNFALRGDVLHLDNIIIKDTSGNVIFAENFETDGPIIAGAVAPEEPEEPTDPDEPDEPDEPGDDVTGFAFPFESYVGEYIPVGEYKVEGTANVIYHIRTNGANNSVAIVRTEDASDGARALRIRAADTEPDHTTLCTEFTVEFGEETVGETYEVSFDAWREVSDWRDYAAINYEGWDGGSRLTNTAKWTVEELGLGKDIGGVGTGTWSRYTASFTTDIAPQINFAVAGWGELHLDNIIVKDSSGNVVFADSFESSGPEIGVVVVPEDPDEPGDEPTDPDEPGEETGFKFPLEDYVGKDIPEGEYGVEGAENVKYIFTFDDTGTPNAQVSTEYATDGTRSLIMGAKGTANKQQGLGAGFTLKFGNPTADGKYDISFDVWIEGGNYRDYAALNNDGWDGKAQLSDANTKTQWTITNLGAGQAVGGVGEGTWSRYTATLSTIADDPQLNFALRGDVLHLDNIIIKDTSGNVIFAENFETDGPIIAGAVAPEEPDEPDEPNEPDVDGTRFEFPFEDYIDEYIPAGNYRVRGTENVIYHIRNNEEDTSVAIVRTADASDGARSFRIRSKDTTPLDKTLCTEFTLKFGNPTADGKYVISFDIWREVSDWRDYATLNYANWSGVAQLTDTTMWTVEYLGLGKDIGGVGTGTWSRYTATLSTIADDPQLNFAVAGRGELHIDNIIIKDTSGNLLFAESFEEDGPIIEGATLADPNKPEEIAGTRFPFPLENYLEQNIEETSTFMVKGTRNVEYSFTFDDKGSPDATLREADASSGTRSMRIRGTDTTSKSRGLGALFTLKFGNQTADGKYIISFDLYRESSSNYDYAALNYDGWDGSARLTGTTKWKVRELGVGSEIGGVGSGTWSRYTATLSTIADDPQLNFAVANGGVLHIDNIIVKDTSGNILFAESFEEEGPVIAAELIDSIIRDAKFEVVEKNGESYIVVGTASKLNSNTIVKTSVKFENYLVEDGISGNVYTNLYKDNILVSSDVQIVTASVDSEASSSAIVNIPDLGNGVYTLKVFVWDDDLNALKNVMAIGE